MSAPAANARSPAPVMTTQRHGFVGVEPLEGRDQLLHRARVEGVEDLRPIEREQRDPIDLALAAGIRVRELDASLAASRRSPATLLDRSSQRLVVDGPLLLEAREAFCHLAEPAWTVSHSRAIRIVAAQARSFQKSSWTLVARTISGIFSSRPSQ